METIIGCSTDCLSQKFSLTIPTKEGDIEIKGYKLNKSLTSVHDDEKIDLNRLWPNLNSKIKREVETNRFSGQVDLIIGQDNYWSLVSEETLIHKSKKYGIINTKLGHTFSGSVQNVSPIAWQRELAEEIEIYNTYTSEIQNRSNKEIEKSLVRLFEKEEEIEDGTYTVEEQYAVDSFLKHVKKEEDGRYTVSPLLKESNVPLKNNYYHARKRYQSLKSSLTREKKRKMKHTAKPSIK